MLLVSVLALLALAGARAEVAGVHETGRHLLQATPTCFECPKSGTDADECGALVNSTDVAPYHDDNYDVYCKCARLRPRARATREALAE